MTFLESNAIDFQRKVIGFSFLREAEEGFLSVTFLESNAIDFNGR